MSWQHLRSYQNGYPLVTVHPHVDLTVLPHWETRPPVLWPDIPLSHYPDTVLTSPCPILLMVHARVGCDKCQFYKIWPGWDFNSTFFMGSLHSTDSATASGLLVLSCKQSRTLSLGRIAKEVLRLLPMWMVRSRMSFSAHFLCTRSRVRSRGRVATLMMVGFTSIGQWLVIINIRILLLPLNGMSNHGASDMASSCGNTITAHCHKSVLISPYMLLGKSPNKQTTPG